MLSFVTVREGTRVAVWNRRGEVRFVDGARRVLLFRETVEHLQRYSATDGEYLAIRCKDGRSEHLRGPVAVWADPVRHETVEVRSCTEIDANEALVVYRNEGGEVTRRVERGPALFMPQAEEWLHTFLWHGADPNKPDRKIPRALRFNKLRVIPDQMYFDVEDVRTADDALLTVKLMIFFELADIEKMLNRTHDPIADFINAVTADVIDLVATLTFERFKERTEALNDIETYGQLVRNAARIGYRINKVVYRGYRASANLQAMHDNAIEARTRLKLESETERQAQELEDMKLRCGAERAGRRREMETEEAGHKTRLRRAEHAETLRQMKLETEADLEARRRKNELLLEKQRAENAEEAVFLKRMQEMQVDLTRYLVARFRNPDRLIRVDGGGNAPQLHVHGN